MKSLLKLRHQARELWDDKYMAKKWLRAVNNARHSQKGWILDQMVKHKNESTN